MRKSPEIGSGHHTTYFRELDGRIGRWWSADPITFPHQSPYNTFDGNPIYYTDASGASVGYPEKEESYKATVSTEISSTSFARSYVAEVANGGGDPPPEGGKEPTKAYHKAVEKYNRAFYEEIDRTANLSHERIYNWAIDQCFTCGVYRNAKGLAGEVIAAERMQENLRKRLSPIANPVVKRQPDHENKRAKYQRDLEVIVTAAQYIVDRNLRIRYNLKSIFADVEGNANGKYKWVGKAKGNAFRTNYYFDVEVKSWAATDWAAGNDAYNNIMTSLQKSFLYRKRNHVVVLLISKKTWKYMRAKNPTGTQQIFDYLTTNGGYLLMDDMIQSSKSKKGLSDEAKDFMAGLRGKIRETKK